MRQLLGERIDIFTLPAVKEEISLFPYAIKEKINILIEELRSFGSLEYPHAKKLKGYDLYEMRIKGEEIYRVMYCYSKVGIVILSGFQKKTQKTPIYEIKKALRRRNNISY